MAKFGPRKTLYWPPDNLKHLKPEWEATWTQLYQLAIGRGQSISVTVYEIVKKELAQEEKKKRKT